MRTRRFSLTGGRMLCRPHDLSADDGQHRLNRTDTFGIDRENVLCDRNEVRKLAWLEHAAVCLVERHIRGALRVEPQRLLDADPLGGAVNLTRGGTGELGGASRYSAVNADERSERQSIRAVRDANVPLQQ